MTWNTLTNLAHDQLVTETHLDEIRENIEHLGAMKFGSSLLSVLATGANAPMMAVGTYTGDGAASKAITGLGFQPTTLIAWAQLDGVTGKSVVYKTSADGTKSYYLAGSSTGQYEDDHIISLDADGFTVGDSTSGTAGTNLLNTNTVVHNYLAWRV